MISTQKYITGGKTLDSNMIGMEVYNHFEEEIIFESKHRDIAKRPFEELCIIVKPREWRILPHSYFSARRPSGAPDTTIQVTYGSEFWGKGIKNENDFKKIYSEFEANKK